ncbi:uncharacterized protein LOC143886403 isoform X2 [Tasmannia lanceolata]|uniref:uncharacterized protein LOC143886403 isoform X2 n=1 Tax=Tasmannia lanceolata TaxID=3420 RepID=UPI004063E7D1
MHIVSSSSPINVISVLPSAKRIGIIDLRNHLHQDPPNISYSATTHVFYANGKYLTTDTSKCLNCGYESDHTIPSYIIKVNVADGSGSIDFALFTDEGQHILGLSATEFKSQIVEANNMEVVNRLFRRQVGEKYVFIISAERNQVVPNSTGISVHSIINIDYSEESRALLHSITAIESRMPESSIADSRKRTREETLLIGNASKEVQSSIEEYSTGASQEITRDDALLIANTCKEGEVVTSMEGEGKKSIPELQKEKESLCTLLILTNQKLSIPSKKNLKLGLSISWDYFPLYRNKNSMLQIKELNKHLSRTGVQSQTNRTTGVQAGYVCHFFRR